MEERTFTTSHIGDLPLRNNVVEVYHKSFSSTDDYCAQDQVCYDSVTLHDALQDADYTKIVLMAGDQVIGFCLLTNNLIKARIAYCNDRYLKRKFPGYTAEGRLYYVTAICILPEMQSQGYGIELLKAVVQFVHEQKSMVAFDYSEAKNSGLPDYIIFAASLMGMQLIEIPLDKQCYTTLHGEHYGDPY